jgi:uncharacterized protein DUF4242
MQLYAIRRKNGWKTGPDLEEAAAKSKQVAADDYPDDIRWIRSYVVPEESGSLGTICIYEATSPDAIRDHAGSVGMPADEIMEIADTVIVRPDPVSETA